MKQLLHIMVIVVACILLTLGLSSCNTDPSAKPKVYSYSVGNQFVTNIRNSKRMLACSVVFEVTKKSVADKAKDTNYLIRNAVNTTLLQLSADDVEVLLNNADLKTLEQSLTDAANEAMETDVFYSAKITDFTAK